MVKSLGTSRAGFDDGSWMANARVHRDVVKETAAVLRRDWCWVYWMYWVYWMLVAKSLRPHIAGPRTTGASPDQASRVIQAPCDSAQGSSVVVVGGSWGGDGTQSPVSSCLLPAALLSRQRPVYHRTWRLAQRLAGTGVLLGSSRRDKQRAGYPRQAVSGVGSHCD